MPTEQSLVSVIMPAYNAERYIADSIKSVIDQTYENWELIVVDDGSTDKTAEIVRALAAEETRIRYVFQENQRLGKARNTGVTNARGPLIAFLDSDDLWMGRKLELQVQMLERANADIVYTDGFFFTDSDPAAETRTLSVICGRIEGARMLDSLLLHNSIPVLSVLMRRKTFGEAGPFEESAPYHGSEDYDLWLKAAGHGAVFYGMEEKLVRYRRHHAAMTTKDSGWLRPTLTVVKRHLKLGNLSEHEQKGRLKGLYRDLISSLLKEGEHAEAAKYMREFAAWDRSSLITSIQTVLMRLWPGGFNIVSRELLYRTEWHLRRLTGKMRGGNGLSQTGNRIL
ncbi:MAG: glycosyltransferase family 2 protein [Pyrinomonadaceae bacterium]